MNTLAIVSGVLTATSLAVSAASSYIDKKQQDQIIDQKVSEALAAQLGKIKKES